MNDWESLVERARSHDTEAFGQLYDRYLRQVYSFVYYRLGDQHDAEDVTAQVFLKALEAIARYDRKKATFLTWLLSIAHNQVIDRYRYRGRRGEVPLEPELLPIELEDPEKKALSKMAGERLWQALEELTKEQREVVVLRFSLSLSGPDIAKVLGKTEGAVKALQHRALRSLERILKAEERVV